MSGRNWLEKQTQSHNSFFFFDLSSHHIAWIIGLLAYCFQFWQPTIATYLHANCIYPACPARSPRELKKKINVQHVPAVILKYYLYSLIMFNGTFIQQAYKSEVPCCDRLPSCCSSPERNKPHSQFIYTITRPSFSTCYLNLTRFCYLVAN